MPLRVVDNIDNTAIFEDKTGGRVPLDEAKTLPVGTEYPVFIYDQEKTVCSLKDSPIHIGEIARLTVSAVSKVGAFLDWGYPKELFLPFAEQLGQVKPGNAVVVALYLDKSGRLAATMKIRDFLKTDGPYKENDRVKATVYNIVDGIGAFCLVDMKYEALLRKDNHRGVLEIGDEIDARVMHVKEDGRLDLSMRERAHKQMDGDGEIILSVLKENGGFLPVNDKTDKALISEIFGMSKAAYKRAVGGLLRRSCVEFYREGLRIKKNKESKHGTKNKNSRQGGRKKYNRRRG